MENLEKLEITAKILEPTSEERNILFEKCQNYINNFLDQLKDAPAYSPGEYPLLKLQEISESETSLDDLLNILQTEVDAIGINPASGKHLGYIPGGGVWSSSLADMLAASTNRYAGVAYASPAAVAMENMMISWLCSIINYPSSAYGNLTSGGSISNLVAIQAARDFHGINSTNIKQAVIYVTGHVHHCVSKAFHTTGLYEANIRSIPMNKRFQMNSDLLKMEIEKDVAKGLKPFLVIATAGTTDVGAVDPLNDIADLCEAYGCWFHVDAAYGGFFILVDELTSLFKGIERSDSVVMDPHKTLFLPYGSGVVLVKDRQALLSSNSRKAAYMKDTYGIDEISPADAGPELSKHFRGLRMWLPLHLHGLAPFRANLKEKWLLCRFFHEEIQKLGFAVGPEPQLSVTIFRFPDINSNDSTQELLDMLHALGTHFFSSTEIEGQLWIRCAVASFRTHLDEIKEAMQSIEHCVTEIGYKVS